MPAFLPNCTETYIIYATLGGLRAQTRTVGSVRARPLVSVRARHITLVYSLVFEHVTLHWYTL